LDLGPVELGDEFSMSFEVEGLPSVVMDVGFIVDLPPTDFFPETPTWADDLLVTIQLRDAAGAVVAESRSDLASWRWGRRSGSGRVFVIAPVEIRDGSKRTLVSIEMESPMEAGFPARLLIAGGGWAMQDR
jgi:hypothetical protein